MLNVNNKTRVVWSYLRCCWRLRARCQAACMWRDGGICLDWRTKGKKSKGIIRPKRFFNVYEHLVTHVHTLGCSFPPHNVLPAVEVLQRWRWMIQCIPFMLSCFPCWRYWEVCSMDHDGLGRAMFSRCPGQWRDRGSHFQFPSTCTFSSIGDDTCWSTSWSISRGRCSISCHLYQHIEVSSLLCSSLISPCVLCLVRWWLLCDF